MCVSQSAFPTVIVPLRTDIALNSPQYDRLLRKILINLQDGAQELGEIFAVAGGMIERLQARIHCRFR